MEPRSSTLFREIHKNTWLKRLSVDNKKVLVGPKKSDRSWVVFCVHDDCEAMLEGYVEPRQAAQHNPEWTVPLQNALHVSHSLIPAEHEYEFVVTLPAEVIRFNAASWEIMQEWVDTLRQKLREMKILSPKENLYSKLPEIRAPLLPTRDPTSPLPAPPPVPAALVPGIERLPTVTQPGAVITATPNPTVTVQTTAAQSATTRPTEPNDVAASTSTAPTQTASSSILSGSSGVPASAMSNTLTQNLINMLSNPVSAYSHQLSNISSDASSVSLEDSFFCEDELVAAESTFPVAGPSGIQSGNNPFEQIEASTSNKVKKGLFSSQSTESSAGLSLAKTFTNNVLADPNTCSSTDITIERVHDEVTTAEIEINSLESLTTAVFQNEPLVIPRPQTSRSSARDKTPVKRRPSKTPVATTNTTVSSSSNPIVASATVPPQSNSQTSDTNTTTNITIIQVSASPLVKTLCSHTANNLSKIELADDQYKSNVQIIPSNIDPESASLIDHKNRSHALKDHQVTKVKVSGEPTPLGQACSYGKIKKTQALSEGLSNISTIISATTKSVTSTTNTITNAVSATNFGGAITHIPIGSQHTNTTDPSTSNNTSTVQLQYDQICVASSSSTSSASVPPSPKPIPKQRSASNNELHVNRINLINEAASSVTVVNEITSPPFVPTTSTITSSHHKKTTIENSSGLRNKSVIIGSNSLNQTNPNNNNNAPATYGGQKSVGASLRENVPSPMPAIRKLLTRGLTEMSITRLSRKDLAQTTAASNVAGSSSRGRTVTQQPTTSNCVGIARVTSSSGALQNEAREQRRRSSSHSDAQGIRNRTGTNNNASGNIIEAPRRPNSPSRLTFSTNREDKLVGRPLATANSRLTLREQQVLELRKEMMHMGGVRIQLRRKDCIGTIALCDAFGAVWVCGWKQKDYPMLYNALHIGDQLVSVAGVNVGCMADVHKIIRNVSGIYIEFILRRLPFGRVYAIRREMDGQCLGIIRDGNTATIVDIVPKSLTARHGLPPKAQSCDGLSLTFWVLTEINGRPLNLFFKDNEVRDRLNAVGRDISILVQPADLVAKMKKQLKSMRSYKDYIVQ